MPSPKKPAAAGLPGDPAMFKVFTEIDIIAHLAGNHFERRLPKGLTSAQFGILNHLIRLDTMETITELASAFQVAQPTMSSTVKKLIEKGFIEFIPDTEDKRIKRVRVTRKGRAMRNKAVAGMGAPMSKFQAAAPDIDWALILPQLTRIRAFLDENR